MWKTSPNREGYRMMSSWELSIWLFAWIIRIHPSAQIEFHHTTCSQNTTLIYLAWIFFFPFLQRPCKAWIRRWTWRANLNTLDNYLLLRTLREIVPSNLALLTNMLACKNPPTWLPVNLAEFTVHSKKLVPQKNPNVNSQVGGWLALNWRLLVRN